MTSLVRSTFDRLVHVETLLWNRCDEELLCRTGLRLGRLEVLRVIASVEQCRVNDIAMRLQITVGAVSKLVDRLEESGHCRRAPNPEDRRSSVLSVTPLGRTALEEAERIIDPLLQRCFADADLHSLNEALSRVEQTLTAESAGEQGNGGRRSAASVPRASPSLSILS
jgi:DNA-binding MarR family transcriptional regulator